jgi:hypothetical protein
MRNAKWIVTVGFAGSPEMRRLEAIEELFSDAGFDASVSAQPEAKQWTLTVDASGMRVSDAIESTLDDVDELIGSAPIAVEAVRPDEYERRAHLPTLPVLLGAQEIADELGVSRQRVHQLRSHPQFPAPLVDVAMGALWDERAIQKFAREWSRKSGRPAAPATAGRAGPQVPSKHGTRAAG